MSRHGHRLKTTDDKDGVMICPESGFRYAEVSHEQLRCLDWNEDDPLPPHLVTGTKSYDEFKAEAEKAVGVTK
jgi:UDP-2-acetamido-3-amino-2,3-dideoxy-glucuronate N-acetyltransferase